MALAVSGSVVIADQDFENDKTAVKGEMPMDETSRTVGRPLDDDDLLLRRIAQQDESAFRALVERHIDRSFALALRLLGNASDAEDVTQDVLLKVWSSRGSWQEGRAKFSTWLYRVITNRCIDIRRRPRTEDMEKAPELEDESPDAETVLHGGEVKTMLDAAMEQLPEQQRTALILSYAEDLSNPEIAEIMDKSVSSVESLLKRGRQNLRVILQKSEPAILDSFTKY